MKALICAGMSLGALQFANAATLSGAGVTNGVTGINLTSIGTTNWAAWNSDVNPDPTPAADYRKATATGTISAISTTGGSAVVRGTGSTAAYPTGIFTWSTSDSNGSLAAPTTMAGLFHETLEQTTNGVHFTITGLPTLLVGQSYLISLYASAFNGGAQATASFTGLTSVSLDGVTHDGTKNTDRFQFLYTPDSTASSLDLAVKLINNTSGADSSHALIQAVAISIVPEPSVSVLGALGLLGLLKVRRR